MSTIKSLIQNIILLSVVGVVIGVLFVLFKDIPDALMWLKFIVFPGSIFIILAALFTEWWDRKLFARAQNRVGPRFWQPLYDTLKYLAKEDISPSGVDDFEFNFIPPVQLMLAFLVAFFIPVYMLEGLISFEGDLLFVIFFLALIGGTIFLLGWASNNPWSIIGGSRAAVGELSLEIPFALALVGPAILTGSLQISTIAGSGYNLINLPINALTGANDFVFMDILYFIPLLILFFIVIQAATAILEKVPFDPAHAEVEIVGGWNVELTGKKYLFTKLANDILVFAVAGLIAAIFLGGPNLDFDSGIILGNDWDIGFYIVNILIFVIKTGFIIFLITMMRTLHSRIRIDQMVSYFWKYYLPITFIALLMIIGLIGADL